MHGLTTYGSSHYWPPATLLRDVLADCAKLGVIRLENSAGDIFRKRGNNWVFSFTRGKRK